MKALVKAGSFARSATPFFCVLLACGLAVTFAAARVGARFPAPLPSAYAADPVCASARAAARGTACTAIPVRVLDASIRAGKPSYLATLVALPDGRRVAVNADRLYAVPPDLDAGSGPRSAVAVTYRGKIVALATDAERLSTWDTPDATNVGADIVEKLGRADVIACTVYLVASGAMQALTSFRRSFVRGGR